MFRQRPLTWLFLLATLLSNVVLICQPADPPGNFWLALGYLLGQSAVLGAWFVLGQSQRLIRGVVFVGGILGLTVTAYLHGERWVQDDFWGRLVAVLSLYGGVAFGVTLLGTLASVVRSRGNTRESTPLRFSLIELFGWTIIVALASLVIKAINFSVLSRRHELFTFHLGSAIIAGSLVWLFMSSVGSLTVKFAIAALLEMIFYLSLPHYSISNSTAISVFMLTHAYVAIWLFVQQLDRNRRDAISRAIPTDTKESNPASVDPSSTS